MIIGAARFFLFYLIYITLAGGVDAKEKDRSTRVTPARAETETNYNRRSTVNNTLGKNSRIKNVNAKI